MKLDRPVPFIDVVQEALVDPKHRMMFTRPWNVVKKEGGSSVLTSHRLSLEQAQIFKLSDDFVRTACETSNMDPGVLLNTFSCARPPYEKMWLEWDEEARLMALAGVIGQDSALRVGALVERYPGADDEFMLTMYWQHRETHPYREIMDTVFGGPRIVVSAVSVRWSVSGGGFQHFKDNVERNLFEFVKNAEADRLLHNALLSRSYVQQWGTFGKGKAAIDRINLNKVMDRLGVCFGVGSKLNMGNIHERMEETLTRGKIPEELGRILTNSLIALEGDIRFIATVLALIQHKWTTRTVFRDDVGPPRSISGTRLKWLDVHECVITAPKERIVRAYKNYVSTGAKRREHNVMGHYCYRHDTGLNDCIHEYEENEKGQDVCKNCHSTRWWRIPHKRGSLEVGKVSKTYRVETP